MTDFDDDLIYILGFIVILILVIGSSIFLGIVGANYSCEKTADALGKNFKYSFWTDCLIENNGQYIPLDNYIGIQK